MSSVHVSVGGKITQKLRQRTEELGRVVEDESVPGTWVLELRDIAGVATSAGSYSRPGDRYSSRDDEARTQVLSSSVVFIWHMTWMRGIASRDAVQVVRDHEAEIRVCVERPNVRN